jgi:adenosylcobinamide kinase/adenosylcobinamide-phosphate guanylyltransferase
LLLGGARSGKSRLAQARTERMAGELVFVATGEALDAEMAERIARHRAERDLRWRTVEAPRDLPDVLTRECTPGRVVLVDCLTLWLSNVMLSGADTVAASRDLVSAIEGQRGTLVLVSNEVGMGIVPETALGRRFRDEAGRLNQAVAAVADEVLFVAAGLAVTMKGASPQAKKDSA